MPEIEEVGFLAGDWGAIEKRMRSPLEGSAAQGLFDAADGEVALMDLIEWTPQIITTLRIHQRLNRLA